jgi:hypothetical protein
MLVETPRFVHVSRPDLRWQPGVPPRARTAALCACRSVAASPLARGAQRGQSVRVATGCEIVGSGLRRALHLAAGYWFLGDGRGPWFGALFVTLASSA